jgi:hypothetical protein
MARMRRDFSARVMGRNSSEERYAVPAKHNRRRAAGDAPVRRETPPEPGRC